MDNPIVQRLKKLTLYWLEFTDDKDARICRWIVKPDEVSMISTFYQLQTSEGNDTADFFIQLTTPFNSIIDYSSGLKSEFLEIIKVIQEETDEADLKLWNPDILSNPSSQDHALLALLNSFAECLQLPEGFLVIFLTPSLIRKQGTHSEWLTQIMEIGISEKVRFMLVDIEGDLLFNDLSESYPKIIHSITPELNMNSAIKELSSSGNPSEPGVQFRKAFVLLTQAIAKRDMSLVKKTSSKAFNIADENDWPHMKIAVKMATAGAYLGNENYDKAYDIYGEAFHYSKEAYQQGDIASGKLAVTTLFSQASAMIGAQSYDIALDCYTKAIPFAEETEDFYSQSEAWRMSGYCHVQLKEDEKAWDKYWKALDLGDKLDEQIRQNGTLPFVGQELKVLAQKLRGKDQVEQIEEKMNYLVGKDWTEKLNVK